jgi:threonine aldolase
MREEVTARRCVADTVTMHPLSDARIELRSDNSVGVAPEILAAVVAADEGGTMAYGADPWTARLHERVAEVFEHDDVAVFPVVSGTAANALGLSALCPPWGAVLCHESAHIVRSEGGATSLFTNAVMHGLPGDEHARLTAAALEEAFASTRWGDPHHSQPAVVSLTQPTDLGTLYSIEQLRSVTETARARGLRVHIDGARVANALAALGCSPAELTWRSGVDVLSLGATKNGALSTDAIVCFDPALRDELTYRLKRAGHVASKMRFQSAQLDAYLTDGLWLGLARTANEAMARLTAGLAELGITPVHDPAVNMGFFRADAEVIDAWEAAGLDFYRMGKDRVRLVSSFRSTPAEIDEVLRRMAATPRRNSPDEAAPAP